jgi:two-component system alkaline phosphatase synthesis response regulator PhoP
MQILVVDDEAPIRELLSFNLKKSGYEVEMAADGRTALQKAPEADLVLLDIMLPEVDGLEVCRQLKVDPQTSGIPIIMLTAKAEEIDRVLGLELGADDYVVKPFSMRELLARVKAVLRRSAKDGHKDKSHEEALTIGGLRLNFSSYQAWLHDKPIALTPKEYKLLKLLVTNPGRAFSRDELDAILRDDYGQGAQTQEQNRAQTPEPSRETPATEPENQPEPTPAEARAQAEQQQTQDRADNPMPAGKEQKPKPIRSKKALLERFKTRLNENLAEQKSHMPPTQNRDRTPRKGR